MPQLYVLFEHVSGFAVFRTTEFEEIAIFLPQVRESICDISKFRSIVFLVAFQPFKEQKNALENLKSVASDELSTDLQLFLENNIPRSKKSKQAVVLGVLSTGLASTISEKLGINCVSSLVITELLRGVRFHFPKLIKGFKDESYLRQSALAMGHHYSRNKINFSRQDCMVIESHDLIAELEKDIRTSVRRVKEWYSHHFPELYNLIGDDAKLYVTCVVTIGDRKNMSEDIEEKLNSLISDSSKVQSILEAVHISMGMEISIIDLENLKMFCERVLALIETKERNLEYLKTKMKTTAPNMSSLIGEVVGSRLISRAGGLNKLAVLPASTLQILGADKKLFRTVKGKKEKDPMCGLLSESEILSNIQKKNKGRMSRMLANKCSLAVRVDCFKKGTNETFGSELLQEVEKNMQIREKIKPVAKKALTEKTFEKKAIPEAKVAGHKANKMAGELDNSIIDEDAPMEVNGSLRLSGAETSEESEMEEDTVKYERKKSSIKTSKYASNDSNSNKIDTNCEKEKISREESDETREDLEPSDEDVTEVKQLKKATKKKKFKMDELLPENTFKKASEVQKKEAVKKKTPLKKRKKNIHT